MKARDNIFYRVLPFAACVGLLAALRFADLGMARQGPQSTTLAIGFLLIGAFISGKAAVRVGLPRISGFLLVGILAGPYATGLLTKNMLAAGKVVEGLAVALIALTAGGEIRLPWVRSQAARLAAVGACQIVMVGGATFATMLLLRQLFPFMPDDNLHAAIIALVFGAIAISNSPTVTIAMIAENRADGPLSRTVLGITVIVDMCVIVLFALVLAMAKDALGSGGGGGSLGATLMRELGGSVVAGIAFGIGIAWFLRNVGRDTPVFVLATCFAIFGLSQALHLETLLVALTAGFWVENFSDARGEELIAGVERVSLPVYAVFFAAAGAKVDLGALASMWPLALLLCSVRAAGIWASTVLGTRLSRAEPVIRRYAWMGLISQAGVTLALASILARSFPEWGGDIQVLIIAMIAIHECVGPIAFQFALKRAGEVGAAERDAEQAPGEPPGPADSAASPGASRPA